MPLLEEQKHNQRIGEMLLDYGLITPEQLARALDRRIISGRRLGSELEELGYVDSNSLLNILSKQYGRPFISLFEVRVPPEILRIFTFERVKSSRILPLQRTGNTIDVAMEDPADYSTLKDLEEVAGCEIRPFGVPHYHIERAIKFFENHGYGENMFDGNQLKGKDVSPGTSVPDIFSLFRIMIDFKASGLLLVAGAPPGLRINGELKRFSMPRLSAGEMKNFISQILTAGQLEEFEKGNDIDIVQSFSGLGRFRINIYRQRNSTSLSATVIHERIPSFDELDLPAWLSDYALKERGLILVTGLSGQGKTTTVASVVDRINSERHCNIVTLEDPIEYLHKHKKSNVNQREIGIDTQSFASGLLHIMRQDPDVIVAGDLADKDSISIVLNASGKNCLVIASVTAINASSAIERIISMFPSGDQPRIRLLLSENLLLVISQKLIPLKSGDKRILACEKLVNSPRIANLIREGKISNIRQLMQVPGDDVTSIDQGIAGLCLSGRISFEDGLQHAENPTYFQELISTGRI